MHILTLLSVDEMLLLSYVDWSSDFRSLQFDMDSPVNCISDQCPRCDIKQSDGEAQVLVV